MVSERLKTELAELRARVLDIREFNAFSPENFQCVCESLKNLQAVMFEMFHETELQRQAQPASEASLPLDLSHVKPQASHTAAA